jgi:hypothetical protein
MNKDSTQTPPAADPKNPLLACTVLVTGTEIGRAICAAGAKLKLPKSNAETLASLNPPRVRIDGI